MLSSSVNQHYLDKVMDLAEEMPVVATEDIFDARGNKLLAKGATVSRALQEKLIVHKLTKPIEASLCVQGGVDARLLVTTAARLLQQNASLAAICEVCQGRGASPAAVLAPLEFGNAMTMMLTIADRAGTAALEHAVTVALIAVCLAKRANLTPEQQTACALAGLLHDIGELYVDPAYLDRSRTLEPHEWAHLVVHPKVGQMLIEELEAYPKEVAVAVGEHHERLDGCGYPRRLPGRSISACGQVLAAAESIAGLLAEDHALERAELGLKLVPGEHAQPFVTAVSLARQYLRRATPEAYDMNGGGEEDTRLFQRLQRTLEQALALAEAPLPQALVALLDSAIDRLRHVQRAAISCGMDIALTPDDSDLDGLLLFERRVAALEIRWRLRDLGRDLALGASTQAERGMLAPLIHSLYSDASEREVRAA
jgi:hypothetical protein